MIVLPEKSILSIPKNGKFFARYRQIECFFSSRIIIFEWKKKLKEIGDLERVPLNRKARQVRGRTPGCQSKRNPKRKLSDIPHLFMSLTDAIQYVFLE
jgi:hypothetical protein